MTTPSGQWLADLDAALARRGEKCLATLPQRDIDDLLAQFRMGRSPEDTAAVLCGERLVPQPWLSEAAK